PRGDRLFGCAARHRQGRPLHRRCPGREGRWAQSRLSRGAGCRRNEKGGVHGARGTQSRQGRGDGLDLRPVLRLRENQRRIPYMSKELEKILERLTQLLPPPPPKADWEASIAFRWRSSGRRGTPGWLQPVRHVHRIKLSDLRGIDGQIERVEQNTRQFIEGKPANNVLLTGARGTGKSSIVKGLLNKYAKQGLRLIEVEKNDLVD